MTLIVLAVAWLVGIVLADILTPSTVLLASGLLLAVVATGLSWRLPRRRLAALACCCLLLGSWRYEASRHISTPRDVESLLGAGEVVLQGAVQGDPKRTEEGQQVLLAVEAAGGSREVDGLVLLSLPAYPTYRYGQRLLVRGELQQPRGPKRPGEFDYRAYLARKGVFVLLPEPQVRLLSGTAGNPLLAALLAFRSRCQAVLLRELPEPQASIAVGVLLGLQSSIPDEVYATFSATGTSHILVVSGWNFTIVATMLASLATRFRLPQGITFCGTLLVLWTYALFVGANATVLRAAFMASLMVLARATSRQSEPWTLLFAAVWLLSALDPNALWDLGFQLSALATASLFAFAAPVGTWLARCPPLRWPTLGWACEALTATLAAQILALPIILYHFGNLSIVAPLANVLLVPVVPYVMLLTSLALLCGLAWLPLGQGVALAAWLVLSWLTEGARLFAAVPLAAVQLPPFPLWMLLAYYILVIGGWLLSCLRKDASTSRPVKDLSKESLGYGFRIEG